MRIERITIDVNGEPVTRIYVTPHYDRDAAIAAVARMRESAARRKPSRKHGATRAVREMRDGKDRP